MNADGDPELIDDSEFYQQLLKEFFESCGLSSSGKFNREITFTLCIMFSGNYLPKTNLAVAEK